MTAVKKTILLPYEKYLQLMETQKNLSGNSAISKTDAKMDLPKTKDNQGTTSEEKKDSINEEKDKTSAVVSENDNDIRKFSLQEQKGETKIRPPPGIPQKIKKKKEIKRKRGNTQVKRKKKAWVSF